MSPIRSCSGRLGSRSPGVGTSRVPSGRTREDSGPVRPSSGRLGSRSPEVGKTRGPFAQDREDPGSGRFGSRSPGLGTSRAPFVRTRKDSGPVRPDSGRRGFRSPGLGKTRSCSVRCEWSVGPEVGLEVGGESGWRGAEGARRVACVREELGDYLHPLPAQLTGEDGQAPAHHEGVSGRAGERARPVGLFVGGGSCALSF